MKITRKVVDRSIQDDVWSVGNQVLYDLCARCPGHDRAADVVAKVWLIGRAYSASVERGKGAGPHGDLPNDKFYSEEVPKAMRTLAFSRSLLPLGELGDINRNSAASVLTAHAQLVRVFQALTGKEKRSLSSKYLHFHYPHLFFIYDSRAAEAVRALGVPSVQIPTIRGADKTYARFVGAALGVREFVAKNFDVSLSPRQLDRLLLQSVAS